MAIRLEIQITGMCAVTLHRDKYKDAVGGRAIQSVENVLLMGGCHKPRLMVDIREINGFGGCPLRPGAEVVPGANGEPMALIDISGLRLSLNGYEGKSPAGVSMGPIDPAPVRYRSRGEGEWSNLGYNLVLSWLHSAARLLPRLAGAPVPLGDEIQSSLLLDRGALTALLPIGAVLDIEHDFGGGRKQQISEGFLFRYAPDEQVSTKVSIEMRQPGVEQSQGDVDPRHTLTFDADPGVDRTVRLYLSAQCSWTEPMPAGPAALDVAEYEPIVEPRLPIPVASDISGNITSSFPRCPSAIVIR